MIILTCLLFGYCGLGEFVLILGAYFPAFQSGASNPRPLWVGDQPPHLTW